MPDILRLLIVEDSADDAALMLREIRRAGFDVRSERVETARSFEQALARDEWDLVIADHALPSFSGLEALRILQERGLDVPFIIVSGVITEETAVSAMKSGAHDWVLKGNLVRLGPAISRELREAKLRHERRRVESELANLREESAAALRRSRDQLDVILRGVAEGVTAIDADGRLVYANEAAATSGGYASVAEMFAEGQASVSEDFLFWDEAGRPMTSTELPAMSSLKTGRVVEQVLRSRRQDQIDHRWHIVTSTPILDESLRPRMAITIFRDITDQKRAEADARYLADASVTLAATLDYSETLAHIADLAAPRLADWTAVEVVDEELPEKTQLAVAHRDPLKAASIRALHQNHPRVFHSLFGEPTGQDRWRASIHGGSFEEAIQAIAPDAEASRLLADLQPRSMITVPLVARGQTIGTMTLISMRTDVGYQAADLALADELARRASPALENARLYRQARDAIAARDEFLSVASHELRTPLTALMLQLQRMQRLVPRGEENTRGSPQQTLEHATRQTSRLATLIESLLDVSRIAVGRLSLQTEELNLSELVRQVTERSTEEAIDARCAVKVEADESIVGAWDRMRVEQVVTNLLSNAFKYGPGKPIDVRVEQTPDSVRIIVRDQGIGISPKDMKRIFGRFERAVSARHYGGLGLGLFIVRQIVDAHGGRIDVESEQGVGSTFVVTLPKHPPATARPSVDESGVGASA